MAREGRACRDRQREGRACRDRQREGRAPARPETAWGKRTSRSSSLPTTYISTLLHGQGHSPRRRGSVATMPHDGEAHPSSDRLRGSLRSGDMSPQCRTTARSTPLATACAAHFVRGICRHNAARRRGRTPLATACAAHFVRGICRHYSDRMRGSLRSGDMSPRMGGRNKCDPPAFLPKSISKWPNAIANRKS